LKRQRELREQGRSRTEKATNKGQNTKKTKKRNRKLVPFGALDWWLLRGVGVGAG
jgi:hypothetical protein